MERILSARNLLSDTFEDFSLALFLSSTGIFLHRNQNILRELTAVPPYCPAEL